MGFSATGFSNKDLVGKFLEKLKIQCSDPLRVNSRNMKIKFDVHNFKQKILVKMLLQ